MREALQPAQDEDGIRRRTEIAEIALDEDAVEKRLDLVFTVTERYYVTEEALAAVEGMPDRDERLIELFELHHDSAYCERLFYHDANPSVGIELEKVDPEA